MHRAHATASEREECSNAVWRVQEWHCVSSARVRHKVARRGVGREDGRDRRVRLQKDEVRAEPSVPAAGGLWLGEEDEALLARELKAAGGRLKEEDL